MQVKITSFAHQNLRDALDNIYDAKVPRIWGKVSQLLMGGGGREGGDK